MFQRLSIARKITAGFTLLMALLVIVGAIGIFQMRSSAETIDNLLKTDLVYGIGMNDFAEDMLQLRRFEKDLFINLNKPEKVQEYKKKWDETVASSRKTLADLNTIANDQQKKELNGLSESLSAYEASFNEIAAQVQAGAFSTTHDANAAFDKYKSVVRKLAEDSDEHAETAITSVKQISGKIKEKEELTLTKTLTLIVIATALGIFAAVYISQSVRKPLAAIQQEITEIDRSGHIGRRLAIKNMDEIGQTATVLNRLFSGMCEVIGQANNNSKLVVTAAHELAKASGQVTNASQLQAEAAASTAAAIEQMSVSVHMIADNAQNMEHESREAAQTASEGSVTAHRAATEINQIAASITRSSELILQLNQRSDEIGSIAMVIKDIADQTNLLALNAAIEAARAGDLGRGFAVVADEVRKLAERTTQATVEITSKIDSVQRDTSTAAEGMRSAGKLVEDGVRSTESVAEALSLIEAVTSRSVEHIASISNAIKEQSSASQEIARHVEQISQASEENHSAAQSTNELSMRLSDIAQDLDKTIHRFTV
ncbi:methyl-accepting chemotaxis protein [Chitinibacter sp. SCUT-21]|uniref:methyl-accepting chemotaxis protein n=1 Tax=Chitinibacter sp. SCUT-21 TaxID=2970891 RepID=UPI0035A69CA2